MSTWTLFSNHGHVLFCLSRDPEARLRDVASDVGITERAVQKIVRDLQDGGMISVSKSGRRNCYQIHKKQSLRHELEAACTLKDLIAVVNPGPVAERPAAARSGKSGPATEVRTETKATAPETETKPAAAQARPESHPRVPRADSETEAKQAVSQASSETRDRRPAAAPEADSKQTTDQPKPVKPASEKTTGRKDPESSNNPEKQQGSLF